MIGRNTAQHSAAHTAHSSPPANVWENRQTSFMCIYYDDYITFILFFMRFDLKCRSVRIAAALHCWLGKITSKNLCAKCGNGSGGYNSILQNTHLASRYSLLNNLFFDGSGFFFVAIRRWSRCELWWYRWKLEIEIANACADRIISTADRTHVWLFMVSFTQQIRASLFCLFLLLFAACNFYHENENRNEERVNDPPAHVHILCNDWSLLEIVR